MFRSLSLTAAISLMVATPAFAQMDHGNMDHGQMDHAQMDHGNMDHGDMDHGDHAHEAMDASDAVPAADRLTLANEEELLTALEAGGEPIVASVLGAVCDFCAIAMNKTFSKRDEVSAVYVDLDEKTLNVVLNPGMSLDDETLTDLVRRAGYQVAKIDRAPLIPSV